MYERTVHPVKLLLAEYDLSVTGDLIRFLSKEGFYVRATPSPADVPDMLISEDFDIVLLDISQPGSDGYALCSAIKGKYDIPVIFISSSDDEHSVVTGLDMGADDYISKPFRSRELLSRIRSVLRRAGKAQTVLEHGDIRVDTVKGLVTKSGKELFLSTLEYRMLLFFLSNKGRVISREKLLEEIWDIGGGYVNDNTLTVYIKRIREKIEDNPSAPQIIRTVRGIGYKVG